MPVENLPGIQPLAFTPTVPPLTTPFAQNSLLAGIEPAVVKRVSEKIDVLNLPNEHILFAENDPGDCLYLIGSGSVKISKKGRGGQQETLTFLMPNDYFGEMALVDGDKRSAQATAAGPTMVGRIDRSTWELLLKLAPQAVLNNFTRSVSQRLRQNNQHFIAEMMRSERLSLIGTTVSSIAHDMNNPIGSILAAAHIIGSKIEDPLILRMTEIIRDAVDTMATMTRELVDFSRGDTRLELQTVPISTFVKQLEPEFSKCRHSCDVQIDVTFDGSVLIDRIRLLRVFANLIRNAREAMKDERPHVLKFSARKTSGGIQFEVSDTGHGIKSDILPTIFEPFVTHGKTNGTGLGLAISKAVIDAHRGTINAQSNEQGTTFTVDLPQTQEAG